MPRLTSSNNNYTSYSTSGTGGGGGGSGETEDAFNSAMGYMDDMFQKSKALQMKDGAHKLELKGIAAGNGYV